MEKQISQKIVKELENKNQIYITLNEIKEMISEELTYSEFANIIKDFINDGILKPIR